MRILCSYSSIEFSCEHFPASLYSREACHPIFYLPQRKLIPYLSKWAAGELTQTDSYLLFLAALNSSDRVTFRTAAIRTAKTPQIVSQNMEKLFRTISKLNAVSNPAVTFPTYIISESTRDLENISFWIDNWEDCYRDFLSGVSRDYDTKKLVQREATLSRLIKNPHKSASSYAQQLAEWAAVAADFPETMTTHHPATGLVCTLREKWVWIIVKCARSESLFSINKDDVRKILEHCESELTLGSIFTHELFKILRNALEKQKNFLGFGDLDLSATTFQILNSTDSVEDGNIRALMAAAPEELPRPEQYPTKFEYLKAKMKYEMALKYQKGGTK